MSNTGVLQHEGSGPVIDRQPVGVPGSLLTPLIGMAGMHQGTGVEKAVCGNLNSRSSPAHFGAMDNRMEMDGQRDETMAF